MACRDWGQRRCGRPLGVDVLLLFVVLVRLLFALCGFSDVFSAPLVALPIHAVPPLPLLPALTRPPVQLSASAEVPYTDPRLRITREPNA